MRFGYSTMVARPVTRARPDHRRASLAIGLLALTLVFCASTAAHAQTAVQVSATPNPFTSGTPISVTVNVYPGASPESWCFEAEDCRFGGAPFLHIYGSNGFDYYDEAWSVQITDPGPGQTLTATTYTVYAGVTWSVCWGPWWYACAQFQQYGEDGWSAPATVTPTATPTGVTVLPASGAGPQQTFLLQYASAAGHTDLAELWLVVHATGAMAQSCVVGYYAGASTFVLWHDSGVGTPEESYGAPGSATVLANSQCRVAMSGASVTDTGTTKTVLLPLEFTASYSGPKNLYLRAKSAAGVYGAWSDLGDWTARARTDSVAPSPVDIGETVTISGLGFGAAPGTVTINGTAATTIPTWTNTSIGFVVPAGATTGPVGVTTAGQASNSVTLTIGDPPSGGEDEIVYYHSDGIGSLRMVTNAAGATIERHDYLPFGEEWQASASLERVRFAGKEFDPETGNGSWMALNYFGARYLHGATGRFTSPDPVVDIASSLIVPQRWNAYAYVLNNPIRYTDPDGRCVFLFGIDTVACAAAGAVLVDAAIVTTAVVIGAAVGYFAAKAEEAKKDGDPYEDDLPHVDSTGRLHGRIPKPQDFGKYSKDELEQLLDEARRSAPERLREFIGKGRQGGHGDRLTQENELIRALERYLGELGKGQK